MKTVPMMACSSTYVGMIHSETNKAQSLVPLETVPMCCSQGFTPSVVQMLPEQSSISQTEQIQLLCRRTPCLTASLCHLSHCPSGGSPLTRMSICLNCFSVSSTAAMMVCGCLTSKDRGRHCCPVAATSFFEAWKMRKARFFLGFCASARARARSHAGKQARQKLHPCQHTASRRYPHEHKSRLVPEAAAFHQPAQSLCL